MSSNIECTLCNKTFSNNYGYKRHCKGNRVHILIESGMTLKMAEEQVKYETNQKISISNTEHAKTHENPRKGKPISKEHREATRLGVLKRNAKGGEIKYLIDTHPEIASEWHPTKNDNKLPSQFTHGSDEMIWWLCPNICEFGCLHEYIGTIGSRTRGTGCPYCCEPAQKICIHMSIVHTHPDIVSEWHPTKNGDLLPSQITHGSKRREIWWTCGKKCPEGCPHEYQSAPVNRCGFNKSNCPFCVNQQICIHMSIAHIYPKIASEWHPTKNGDLLPSSISVGSGTSRWWRCSDNHNHEWEAPVKNRTSLNSGCPDCKHKTEKKLGNYLRKVYSVISQEKTICSPKQFDFYIEELKLIIELDGLQHFKHIPAWKNDPEKNQSDDVFKMKCAIEKGYRIIRLLQEDVLKNDEKWLDELLKPHLTLDGETVVYISPNNSTIYDCHKNLIKTDLDKTII
jgi:very-short-patch-repair endonuclease